MTNSKNTVPVDVNVLMQARLSMMAFSAGIMYMIMDWVGGLDLEEDHALFTDNHGRTYVGIGALDDKMEMISIEPKVFHAVRYYHEVHPNHEPEHYILGDVTLLQIGFDPVTPRPDILKFRLRNGVLKRIGSIVDRIMKENNKPAQHHYSALVAIREALDRHKRNIDTWNDIYLLAHEADLLAQFLQDEGEEELCFVFRGHKRHHRPFDFWEYKTNADHHGPLVYCKPGETPEVV